ncbi:MAG: hypothetical protein Ct9H90mP22_7340 [Gammaproteobacteria bacterium]|nr:MAG: hypothetical protein Ct9H90mP22_7340 [Gammaproteobacteria bacterium]
MKLERKNFMYFDATCPFGFTKVHLEVQRHARKGRDIVLIGHKGHPEFIGTLGRHPEDSGTNIYLVENNEDINKLEIHSEEIAYVTQTTLSVDDTQGLINALQQNFPQALLGQVQMIFVMQPKWARCCKAIIT